MTQVTNFNQVTKDSIVPKVTIVTEFTKFTKVLKVADVTKDTRGTKGTKLNLLSLLKLLSLPNVQKLNICHGKLIKKLWWMGGWMNGKMEAKAILRIATAIKNLKSN